MALLKVSALVTYVFTHVSFFVSLPYLRFSVSDLTQMNVKESLTLTSKESLFTIAKFLHLFTWNGFKWFSYKFCKDSETLYIYMWHSSCNAQNQRADLQQLLIGFLKTRVVLAQQYLHYAT